MRPVLPAVVLALVACAAQAQSALPADEAALRAYVSQQVAAAAPSLTRFEVQFLAPAMAPVLAPCARTEFFMPAGARPWGRVSVGVRCAQGAAWTVMVAAAVRAWGPALVAQVPLAAGAVPGPQDVREQEAELTREPAAGVLRDPAALQGRALARPIGAGQVLRADMLRVVQVIQAGDPVRLRLGGAGFAVTATGQALAGAGEGQPVRVRTEFGKILTGIARDGRAVDVAL
jgi:flagellar basal body P-ring formation protein FlgA